MKDYEIENLKKDYESLRKKYSLPSFRELNEEFEIEVLADFKSEILLKKIRKVISERITSVLRILEALINPSNSSIFLLNILKGFNEDDKKFVEMLYKKLNQVEIELFSLDIKYNEENEAKFIRNFMLLWKEVQKDLKKIESMIKKSLYFENKKQQKSYLG